MDHPFVSAKSFRLQFNNGLEKLLNEKKLETFILCLANATNDADLFNHLKKRLQQQFNHFLYQYQASFEGGQSIEATEEDLLVFIKLQVLGFSDIQLSQQRESGNWLCQYNQLRSFRPKRMANFKHNGDIFTPFDKLAFNFNKPFMHRECFWAGEFNGKPLDLFYNKYPFADLHGLLVPERETCLPQFLLADKHHYIWRLTQYLADKLPATGIAYNSYGAYASVNHLHFQMFNHANDLPICQSHWCHNGGDLDYPLQINKSTDAQQAWEIIHQLHQQKQPYNLLYQSGEIYIMPRKVQGSVEVPEWSSGFSWYELCGGMLVSNLEDYLALSEAGVAQLLAEQNI